MLPVIVIVLARGGSKRIAGKNLANIGGTPLVRHTLDSMSAHSSSSHIILSSDSEVILSTACPISVIKHSRSVSAGDTDSSEKSINEVIGDLHSLFSAEGWIVLAQPTSPFRKRSTVYQFFTKLRSLDPATDSLVTFGEINKFYWKRDKNDDLFLPVDPSVPRRSQDRKCSFYENGSLYGFGISFFRSNQKIFNRNIYGQVCSSIECIDIDEPEDLELANACFPYFLSVQDL